MALYQRRSQGPEAARIQSRLQELALYAGPIDGDFGDGAEGAVRVTNRRAEAANPKWVEDVRTRKLTIADGEGTVHGRVYDLQEQYGIGLAAA
jgi:hypothetical protein